MSIAVPQSDQQEAITCAGRHAFTGGTDGLLAPCSCQLKLAILTAKAVSVTVETPVDTSV